MQIKTRDDSKISRQLQQSTTDGRWKFQFSYSLSTCRVELESESKNRRSPKGCRSKSRRQVMEFRKYPWGTTHQAIHKSGDSHLYWIEMHLLQLIHVPSQESTVPARTVCERITWDEDEVQGLKQQGGAASKVDKGQRLGLEEGATSKTSQLQAGWDISACLLGARIEASFNCISKGKQTSINSGCFSICMSTKLHLPSLGHFEAIALTHSKNNHTGIPGRVNTFLPFLDCQTAFCFDQAAKHQKRKKTESITTVPVRYSNRKQSALLFHSCW